MVALRSLWVLFGLLLLSVGAVAKSPPPGVGASLPANIMLMLDTSGSMGWTLGATFERPYDIAVDGAGHIYLTEYYRNRVTKYDSAGNYLFSWGSYGSGSGYFYYPRGIAIDGSNNVYVADRSNHRIQKFSSDGTYINTIGASVLYRPGYVAVDSVGNLYVTEYNSNRVSKFNASGSLVARWGSYGSGNGQFRSPRGIAVDPNGFVYVSDTVNHRIQKFDSSGQYVNQIGGYGSSTGSMIYPSDIAVGSSSGYLFVMDRENDRIQRFNLADIPDALNTELTATEVTALNSNALVWGSWGSGDGQFNNPYGIGVLNSNGYSDENGLNDGDLLVAGYQNNRYQRFSEAGVHEQTVGTSNRLEQAKKVIKAIVSDSDLTRGANFGMITWNSSATLHTCISRSGAESIKSGIDSLTAGGGTYLNYAMAEAQNRFNTACWPYDTTQCLVGGEQVGLQKNFMIVISDGVWNGHSTAESIVTNMNQQYGVKTFVIGFMLGGDVGDDNYEALAAAGNPGLTPPASPLYAENWEELYAQLALAIRKAIDERLEFSFTSPVTMPALRKGNSLYRSHFIYHKDHQWEGHLTKYALSNRDGTLVEPPLWDAGAVLNLRSPDSRRLFTVEPSIDAPDQVNYDNFVESNAHQLAPILYPGAALAGVDPVPRAELLIRFVRGHDAFDEYAEANTAHNPAPSAEWRWKLADIYNAEVAVVSVPDAQVTTASEQSWRESYYRYLNGYQSFVTAHAARQEMVYAGSNGGILHAFKGSDGSELWGFIPPPLLDKLRNMDIHTEFANSSNSIYGVDGAVVVKDIRIEGSWKTVLLAGLGAGGRGYFALDVTDPDAPKHLFSVENQPEHDRVRVWSATGEMSEYSYSSGNTIAPEWDYSLLGEAWSTPVILNLHTTAGDRWVAVFGNGYNQNRDEIAQAALYVMDLENGGQLLLKAELDEVSGDVVNTVPASPVAINGDALSEFQHRGAVVYVPDFEGTLWKVDLSDAVESLSVSSTTLSVNRIGKLFRDTAMTTRNGRLAFHGATAAKGSLWLYYSTSNQQDLYSPGDQNRLYGIVDPDFPHPRVVVSTASVDIEPTLMDAGVVSTTPTSQSQCPPPPDRGWFATLDAGIKVTDRANVKNAIVYYPLFTPNGTDQCASGDAGLVGVNMYCGNTLFYRQVGEGILKGGVHHRGQTYYSLGGEVQSSAPTTEDPWGIQNNVVVSPPPLNRVIIDSWREEF